MPPRTASAVALVTVFPAPVTASFLCWGAGVGVADGVGTGAGVVDGVGVGTGVADGLGSGVVDGLGDADGVTGVGLGLGDADGVTGVGLGVGAGVGVGTGVGLGDADGVGTGVGVGAGLGAGVGVLSNPALPPDSRRTTRVLTSQDLSWEVMVAESLHGPGSAGSTPTFSWSRAFSP